MNPNSIARQYRELAVKGATPVGLIVLLYDMAIESLARASRQIDAGNIEARTTELNHAMAVITELQRSLNLDGGGEVARRLTDLYDVARGKIMEANIKSSKEIVERLVAVLSSVREAWQIVERETAGDRPENSSAPHDSRPASASGSPPAETSETGDDRTHLQWSA